MDKRQDLRRYFQSEAITQTADKQYTERTAQLNALEGKMVEAFNVLIKFLDGKTTKTEVVNQLKSISTPDVDKVVQAIIQTDKDKLTKEDLKTLEASMNKAVRELSLIPKTHAKYEQKESVKVTNLSEIKHDNSDIVKAIEKLDIKPVVDVKAPIVNVEKTDLKPLENISKDILKATKENKVVIPDFPEIPVTDLSKVEKKLDESNKHLKAITEKRFGGGGGGGNGTPYVDNTGKASYVELVGGAVPITGSITASASTLADFSVNDIEEATTSYFGYTKPDGTWLVKSLTATSVSYATETNNVLVTTYTDAWTARATLTYGRFDQAF